MTNSYLQNWLQNKRYYRLQLGADPTDNPDQRIAEDLSFFPANTLILTLGLLGNIVQAVSFSVVLWDLSGSLTIPLGASGSLTIPGYMFWAVIIYVIGGSWMTIKIGRPLVPLSFAQQRLEADFRFSLVRFRENTESIAFYGGEEREMTIFRDRFGGLFGNFFALMIRTRLLGFYTGAWAQAAVLFPYLLMAPRYFAERLLIGSIQQVADAFGQMQGSLSWIVNTYANSSVDLNASSASIAGWSAIVTRLTTFLDRLDEIEAQLQREQPIEIKREGHGMSVPSIDLDLPDGRSLRHDISLNVASGEAMLIMGRTGTGKSTLLRALAGIWPFGHGKVRLDEGRAFFLPQKPYIPLGNLRHALVYPDEGTGIPRDRLIEALGQVGLGHLTDDLDTVDNWSLRLSGGEQQRLAVARVLLAKPSIIFLDEATASLDEAGEQKLYKLLRDLPWRPTIVSVGHRGTLRNFHDHTLDLSQVGHVPQPAE
jgi:putative ATP-binding cassette transporter